MAFIRVQSLKFWQGPLRTRPFWSAVAVAAVFTLCRIAVAYVDPPLEGSSEATDVAIEETPVRPGTVTCANLVYGEGKSSVCFSPEFLAETGRLTNIVTHSRFVTVNVESPKLFDHPFAVWTGEGDFQLTDEQRTRLRTYLTNGGFVVASAGCSSPEWIDCCRNEMTKTFPDVKLSPIALTHPIFHSVHDILKVDCRKAGKAAVLEGLEIDGRIVLVFSSDGLNDTAKAGKGCCCCGGNEIKNARQININLLAYALTH